MRPREHSFLARHPSYLLGCLIGNALCHGVEVLSGVRLNSDFCGLRL